MKAAKLPSDGTIIARHEDLPDGIEVIDAKDVNPDDFEYRASRWALRAGLMEHVVRAIRQPDGRFVIRTQLMITAKGIVELKNQFGIPLN